MARNFLNKNNKNKLQTTQRNFRKGKTLEMEKNKKEDRKQKHDKLY